MTEMCIPQELGVKQASPAAALQPPWLVWSSDRLQLASCAACTDGLAIQPGEVWDALLQRQFLPLHAASGILCADCERP